MAETRGSTKPHHKYKTIRHKSEAAEVGITAQEFYEANATNVCNVPRVGHPEDPSGWAGVRRASEARFVAGDCLVMTLADAFDFAEKYKGMADNQDSPLMRLREKIAEEPSKVCPECGCEVVNSAGLLVCECPAGQVERP